MKFQGHFSLIQQPYLWGKSDDTNFSHYVKSSCHEFSAESVEFDDKYLHYSSSTPPVSKVPSTVTYIAGKYPEGFLHGPASSLVSKSIIYPCNKFRCRLDCPCNLCRMKRPLCLKAENSSNTCGDCSDCRLDYNDHLLHHRARHLRCKFCEKLHETLPQYSYKVLYQRYYGKEPEAAKAYLFQHCWIDRFQITTADPSGLFKCDNCPTMLKRKADLRRHEIALHFQSKHSCHLCGTNFTRFESLLEHARNIHDENGETFRCNECEETFSRKSNFLRHIEGKNKNDCTVCGNKYCTRRKLLKHLQIHKTHECAHCKKTFSKKQSLTMHLKKREEKLCTDCGELVCNLTDLTSHNFKHRHAACEICGQEYLKTSLENHKLMNHAHSSSKSYS